MDPISTIVLALAIGAATFAAKTVAAKEIEDRYVQLKKMVAKNYGVARGIEALEEKPNSEAKKQSLDEDMREFKEIKESEQQEALRLAQAIIDKYEKLPQNVTQTIGLKLKDVTGRGILREGEQTRGSGDTTGTSIESSEFTENLIFRNNITEGGLPANLKPKSEDNRG